MRTFNFRSRLLLPVLLAALLLGGASPASALHTAVIPGISGPDFVLAAKSGHISTADGNSLYFWGFAEFGGSVQYPGPTLIVDQGQTVTIRLSSHIREAVSIVIPGFDITASGGVPGLLTREAPPDKVTEVTYSFVADRPGTFLYYSGSHSDLQTEMGLFGALIVRPTGQDLTACSQYSTSAYGDCRSAYDLEYLFLLSEMDMNIHDLAEQGRYDEIDMSTFWPVYWFINGRNAPDTMMAAGASWLPAQPYNCMPMVAPGKRMLLRLIGAGHDKHPFHTHGNNFDLIARDGWVLESDAGSSRTAEVGAIPDLAVSDFTQTVAPGASYDAIFSWSGKDLGWDIFDASDPTHMAVTLTDTNGDGYDDTTYEYIADHGKPIPVQLPGTLELTYGGFYSGSPFLGAAGSLPPGEGGNNPNAGFAFMWHSHNEKEMTNNDIFPGGLMTMMIVEPSGM